MMKKLVVSTAIIGICLSIFTVVGVYVRGKEKNMHVLDLQKSIGAGKEKEIKPLFDGNRRKIVQITLRSNAVLEAHKAAEPITIQCIAGNGILIVGDEKEKVELKEGVLVTIEPNIIHEIRSTPEVSILLTKFTEK